MRTELYVLGGMHIPNPVTQGVLLEELFGEVLEIPLGEGDVRGHGNLGVAWNERYKDEEGCQTQRGR